VHSWKISFQSWVNDSWVNDEKHQPTSHGWPRRSFDYTQPSEQAASDTNKGCGSVWNFFAYLAAFSLRTLRLKAVVLGDHNQDSLPLSLIKYGEW
jgi:hypothetical protein